MARGLKFEKNGIKYDVTGSNLDPATWSKQELPEHGIRIAHHGRCSASCDEDGSFRSDIWCPREIVEWLMEVIKK
jgi:hypothetical protein